MAVIRVERLNRGSVGCRHESVRPDFSLPFFKLSNKDERENEEREEWIQQETATGRNPLKTFFLVLRRQPRFHVGNWKTRAHENVWVLFLITASSSNRSEKRLLIFFLFRTQSSLPNNRREQACAALSCHASWTFYRWVLGCRKGKSELFWW